MIFDVDNHPVAYVLLMKTLAERSAHALGGHGMNTELTASMAWLIGFCVLAEAAREVCANHTALLKAMMKPMTWLGGA
jgi:hypothetical protein